MQEADLSETRMAMQGLGTRQFNPADYEGLAVRFSMEPWHNKKASKEAGRPIYDDIPFVDIRKPGDRNTRIFRPVAEIDKQRWPRHWKQFLEDGAEAISGTPLEQWPAITRGMAEELRYFNVRTVEELAGMADSACQNFMGIQSLRDRAKAFLAVSQESAEAEQLAAELNKRDAEIAALKAAVAELKAKAGD